MGIITFPSDCEIPMASNSSRISCRLSLYKLSGTVVISLRAMFTAAGAPISYHKFYPIQVFYILIHQNFLSYWTSAAIFHMRACAE